MIDSVDANGEGRFRPSAAAGCAADSLARMVIESGKDFSAVGRCSRAAAD